MDEEMDADGTLGQRLRVDQIVEELADVVFAQRIAHVVAAPGGSARARTWRQRVRDAKPSNRLPSLTPCPSRSGGYPLIRPHHDHLLAVG